MKLRQIALGFDRTAKSGKDYIRLTFAPDVFDRVPKEELAKAVMFKKVSKMGKRYYSLCCSVPEDYEPEVKLESNQEVKPTDPLADIPF